MSGKLLPFGGGAHEQSLRRLPWLANGTLDADERASVEAHLRGCRQCQVELALLREVQVACVAVDEAVPPPAFARLRTRIEAGGPVAPAPWRARLSGWTRGWRAPPGWLRGLACVQAALLLVLATWTLRAPAPPAPAYRTLGSGAAAGVVAAGEARLVVVFVPGLDQASTRQLLRASGARIVDGPSDAGAYVVAVEGAHAVAARDALRAARGVQLVELLDPAAAR